MNRRGEHGLSVLEVVVALTLVGTVFASITSLIGRTAAALGAATDRDGAQEIANVTLERAKAFGCGLAISSDSTAATDRWKRLCWGSIGDSSFTTSVGTTSFTAVLHTAWKQVGAGRGCIDPHANASRSPSVGAAADGLDREVTVQWRTGPRLESLVAHDYESVPPDAVAYHDAARGAVLLEGSPGDPTSVTAIGGTAVARTIDTAGCDLFPFLPAGSARWTIGASGGTVDVIAGRIIVEPSGRVVA